MRPLYMILFTCLLSLLSSGTLTSQQNFWEQTNGPPGGDFAGAFAMNVSGHIFCASHDGGTVYRSTDHGLRWVECGEGLTAAEYRSMAINRKGYIFLGANSGGGIFRSTDNGETWTRTTFPYAYPLNMAIDSLGNLLVATWFDGAGIIRSTDDGDTWSAIGQVTGMMQSIAVNATGDIFAGSASPAPPWQIYRSTDNGFTWDTTEIDFEARGFAFNSLGHIYALRSYSHGYPGLYVSTNNGTTWNPVLSCPPVPDGAGYSGIAIDSADNIIIGVMTSYATELSGRVYRSTDGCATWQQISDFECWGFILDQQHHLLAFTRYAGVMHSTDMGDNWQYTSPVFGRIRSLRTLQTGQIVAGLDYWQTPGHPDWAGTWFSDNGGLSWKPAELFAKSIQCVIGIDSSSILVGTSDGVYSSSDLGKNWMPSGLLNTSVWSIERATNGDLFAGTQSSGLYHSTDDGGSWSYLGLIGTNVRSIVIDALGSMYVGSENNGVYRSTDGGLTWDFVGLPNTTVGSMTDAGGQLFVGTNSGLFRSADNGTSWAFAGLAGRVVQDLLATSPNDMYAATSDSGAYRSTNGGQTWSALVSGLNHRNVTSLALDPEGFLYAGTDGGGVYRSTQLITGINVVVPIAQSWNLVSVPVEPSNFQRANLFPSSISQAFAYLPGVGYAPTNTLSNGPGYWLKFPAAGTVTLSGFSIDADSVEVLTGWNLIGSISSSVSVDSIGSIPGGIITSEFIGHTPSGYGAVSVLEPGVGYWVKASQPGLLVLSSIPPPMAKIRIVATGEMPPAPPGEGTTESMLEKPREFALAQNYPNPFNPSTTIRYELPKTSHVSLSIFDMLGREVVMLLNEEKSPGAYTVQWDASALCSGVYFYRLKAESFTETKRLLLLK
jgi:photosystem II stability/assembly factor-like uncharacterized protein